MQPERSVTVWRVRFKIAGAHVHCNLYAANSLGTTYAKCGEVVVRRGEQFASFLRAFPGAEFLGEGDGVTAACREG